MEKINHAPEKAEEPDGITISESPETVVDTPSGTSDSDSASAADRQPSLDDLLHQAYLRGRNEALSASIAAPDMLAEPGVGTDPGPQTPASSHADDLSSSFLSRIRPSVWDL